MAAPGAGFAPGRHPVEAIGRGGFLFGGVSHIGSILALPSGVHAWEVAAAAEIDLASLSLALAEIADIDLLLIGAGERFEVLDAEVRMALRDAGVKVEVMSTSSATQTYNILLDEGRRVAAALIAVR